MSILQRHLWHTVITYAENTLAAVVIFAVAAYAIGSAQVLLFTDWTQNEAFYQFIYRVLIITIGLELARMLITHSFSAVLELLAFVIARKMLRPDLSSIDIGISVLAFVALAAARHYFMRDGDDRMSAKLP
jgi:hypothetical protein